MSEIEITNEIKEMYFLWSRIKEQLNYILMIQKGSLPEERKKEIIESATGVLVNLHRWLLEIAITNPISAADALLTAVHVKQQ